MAEEEQQSFEDRTEEATPERREEFRDKGYIAISRELVSVAILATSIGFFTYYAPIFMANMQNLLAKHFQNVTYTHISAENILNYAISVSYDSLYMIIPVFLVTITASVAATFLQTRFNFSWERVSPDFDRLNPLSGLVRMVNVSALVELVKGIAKITAIGFVAYLVFFGEWIKIPGLMIIPMVHSWGYWAKITQNLFWGVSILLLAVAALDYFYNFMSLEQKMKMTKKEIKEEMKRREVDPHVKARIRRMQRDIVSRRMMDRTKQATVVIVNPTHFSVALKYELGMRAPTVVAKGQDFLALRMRELAKELNIPIVENKPLARTLYKIVEVGHEIPESLYKAVSEIIRYVFKLKGINVNKTSTASSTTAAASAS